jgi:hypothetical protein
VPQRRHTSSEDNARDPTPHRRHPFGALHLAESVGHARICAALRGIDDLKTGLGIFSGSSSGCGPEERDLQKIEWVDDRVLLIDDQLAFLVEPLARRS